MPIAVACAGGAVRSRRLWKSDAGYEATTRRGDGTAAVVVPAARRPFREGRDAMRRLLACAALAALATVAARADAPNKMITDQEFIQKASAAGLAEVNMAKMALQNATTPAVKEFAQRMLNDHTKANRELNRIADANRMTPAANMDAAHQEMSREMSAMTGENFDRRYVRGQLKDHEAAVALFQAEAKNGKNPQLKEFAVQTLPTLREHQEMVRKLASRFGEGGSNPNRER